MQLLRPSDNKIIEPLLYRIGGFVHLFFVIYPLVCLLQLSILLQLNTFRSLYFSLCVYFMIWVIYSALALPLLMYPSTSPSIIVFNKLPCLKMCLVVLFLLDWIHFQNFRFHFTPYCYIFICGSFSRGIIRIFLKYHTSRRPPVYILLLS